MKKTKLLSRRASVLAAALVATAASSVAHADPVKDVIEGFTAEGKVSLNARARYEYNGLSGADDVNGLSIRTRLGYTTGEYKGFKAMIEMEDVTFADVDNRPALDVPVTEMNRAWLSYTAEEFTAKFGRQIVALDDQRFIGHVGWRQNIQTFDSLSSVFNIGDVKVNATYLDTVQRINATAEDLNGFVLNGAYSFSPELNVTAFTYLLDFDDKAAWASDTFGLRATGKFGNEDVTYNYMVSYAKQTDNSGSLVNFDVNYLAAEFSGVFSGMTAAIGYESLGSDNGRGFTTPLATVHKFNGFADVFAGNSIGGSLTQGLQDLYLKFAFKAGPVPITLFYHDFETDEGGIGLGTEIDAVASYKLNEYVTLISKYAYYNSDESTGVTYGGKDKTLFTLEANLAF